MSQLTTSPKDSNSLVRYFIGADKTTEIINKLSGKNLLKIDSETGFYASWAVGKEWLTIKNRGTVGLGRLLPRGERQEIEDELESIEAKFNESLQQKENLTISPQLSLLLKRVKELQAKIYHPQGSFHLTYPFFLRVFTLHLALIQARTQSTEDSQASLNSLVFNGILYLQDALDFAYRERYQDIVIRRGGARNELGYVEDSRKNRSLTQWVAYAENEESLRILRKHLSAKFALKYVEGINFSLAWSALDEFVKLLPSAEEETKVFSLRKAAEAQIAQWRETSETTAQADTFNSSLLMPTAYDEEDSLAPEEKDAADYVKEYYTTLAIGMIGDLPIPGAATLSALTGLFISWIFGGQDDKWKKYADAIEMYIAEEIADLERTQIENDLRTAEEEFNHLCKILDEQEWNFGQDLPFEDELIPRFETLIYNLSEIRYALYDPKSERYKTFPLFDRLFTLYGAVLGTVTTTLQTYDTYEEFRELFVDSRDYLDEAIRSAVNERYWSIYCDVYGPFNDDYRLYDIHSSSHFSDGRVIINGDLMRATDKLMKVELGYVYPNRLKMLAGIRNFDKIVTQYNDFWSERKSDHVAIQPLWPDWFHEVEEARGPVNGSKDTLDEIYNGLTSRDDEPPIYQNLYFNEPCYRSHFHGPRLYKDGSSESEMYIVLTDYPRLGDDILPIEEFDHLDISPVYKVVVYSEENFEGTSYTFTTDPADDSTKKGRYAYPQLSECGFTIKSLKVIYIKSH